MLGAILATILFAFSAVSGARVAKLMGGTEANFWRLSLATLFLAALAHGFGAGLAGDGFYIFILSGCIGFGLGDVSLFQAYPRLGSRLTILIVHCLAAPFAGLVEWLWLGTTLTAVQVACGGVILTGVAIALAPEHESHEARRQFGIGIFFAVLGAIGQGGGVVLSRKAYELCRLADQPMDGLTAAYQRILGGVIISGLALLVVKRQFLFARAEATASPGDLSTAEKWRTSGKWLFFNALAGPTLGVSCYQWALKTTPSAVVLPIVALSPLVVMPFARWLEHERPSPRSTLGAVIAVAGAVGLALAK
ncbi:MAG: EamA family transporter [Proteobacteria bacterium]|nr:EamA family transporter [Verrucomicrobiota bacterium]NBU09074.1 EamA family transporter [Pseudomonadota bacterium]